MTPNSQRAFTVQVAGTQRTYEIVVPQNLDNRTAHPLTFVFHGAGGSIANSRGMGLQDAQGASDGIFVFPQGILLAGYESYGNGWNQTCGAYDMDFFNVMRQAVENAYCINTQRVFATGFSWGADMTDALACCLGDVLRAVAPASGDEVDWNSTCVSARPAFRLTYADNDAYTQAQFDASVAFFRAGNHCAAQSDPVAPSPCIAYRSCDHPVMECRYAGLGHNLPPNWAQETWDFLSSFQ